MSSGKSRAGLTSAQLAVLEDAMRCLDAELPAIDREVHPGPLVAGNQSADETKVLPHRNDAPALHSVLQRTAQRLADTAWRLLRDHKVQLKKGLDHNQNILIVDTGAQDEASNPR